MRAIHTNLLQPGMKVGRDVFLSKGEALLKAGVSLTPGYIKKLASLGIPFIYVDDGLLTDVVVEDVIAQETRVAAVRQVKNILVETKDSGRLVIEPKSIYSTVSQFTGELLASQSLMLNLVDLRSQDDYTFAHSVNVCILAMMTGISLGYTKDQLATLGVGALLHDLGKLKIPDSILNKPGKLTPEEYSIMKEHPKYSCEMIRARRGLEESHAQIALQHHENYDGSGYPQGITGKAFQEYAQITAIADRFDALTADRIYRKAFPPHEAYEMFAGSGGYLFDERVVRAFLRNIAAYPSGTLVELNTGEIAVVVDTPKGYSLFPRVRVLFDQELHPLEAPREMTLAGQKEVLVLRVLPEAEINSLLN